MMRFSFRQKLLLTYAACTLVLIFMAFVSVSYYINQLQKNNVKEALEVAEDQALKMANAVHDILATSGNKDIDDPAVSANIRNFTKINLILNKNIVWAAVISPSGDRMIKEYGTPPSDPLIQRNEKETDVSDLSLPDGNKLEVAVTASPGRSEERRVGKECGW